MTAPSERGNLRYGIVAAMAAMALLGCAGCQLSTPATETEQVETIEIDRERYMDRLHGFWLGQSIGNWTGLVTEMDKIGGDGPHGHAVRADVA